MMEDLVTKQRLKGHVVWAFPHTHGSLPGGEEFKKALDRKQGGVELRVGDLLIIGQPDGGTYDVFVG